MEMEMAVLYRLKESGNLKPYILWVAIEILKVNEVDLHFHLTLSPLLPSQSIERTTWYNNVALILNLPDSPAFSSTQLLAINISTLAVNFIYFIHDARYCDRNLEVRKGDLIVAYHPEFRLPGRKRRNRCTIQHLHVRYLVPDSIFNVLGGSPSTMHWHKCIQYVGHHLASNFIGF